MTRKPLTTDAPQSRITFPDLVRIHFRWHQALRGRTQVSDEELQQLDRAYHEGLARFEEDYGRLVNAYWCADVESGVALMEGKPRRRWPPRRPGVPPRFHRVSDLATRDQPEIARALHQCDELAIRAGEVLRGRNRLIAVQLVLTSACHLLSLVDARGEKPSQVHAAAVAAEVRELAAVRRGYRAAANGDAQLVYFSGMAIGAIGGAIALALLYLAGSSALDDEGAQATTIFGCLFAGAVGAVVSVIARVNSGSFALDSEISRGYTRFLGALRPAIGSVFGLLIYFAVTSDFVEIFQVPEDTTDAFYFLFCLAFAAGFSERWAQDTLTGGLSGRGRAKDGAAVGSGETVADEPPPDVAQGGTEPSAEASAEPSPEASAEPSAESNAEPGIERSPQ
ncbi:MAG: hypothetical protein Q8O56_03620 [Solirubrobacteraceae bacterium]|nr:hypothetical protein [Solirubrobacteraceae bacterium]